MNDSLAKNLADALDVSGNEGVYWAEGVVRESAYRKLFQGIEGSPDPGPDSPELERANAILEAATKGINIDHDAINASLRKKLGLAPEGVDQEEWDRLKDETDEMAAAEVRDE